VQEWVPGRDSDVIFCLQYYGATRTPLISFVGRKIRQWIRRLAAQLLPPLHTTLRLSRRTTRFFQAVGMRGLCSMEFRRSATDGQLYMIEPTACRADYQEGVAVANGYNIPYAAYSDICSLAPYRPTPTRRPVKWVSVGDDYKAACHYVGRRELTWWRWLVSLLGQRGLRSGLRCPSTVRRDSSEKTQESNACTRKNGSELMEQTVKLDILNLLKDLSEVSVGVLRRMHSQEDGLFCEKTSRAAGRRVGGARRVDFADHHRRHRTRISLEEGHLALAVRPGDDWSLSQALLTDPTPLDVSKLALYLWFDGLLEGAWRDRVLDKLLVTWDWPGAGRIP